MGCGLFQKKIQTVQQVTEDWQLEDIVFPGDIKERRYGMHRRLVLVKFVYVLVHMRCAFSWQSNININPEASPFQRDREQHTMPDTCCAVGCQNRIEILSKFSYMRWKMSWVLYKTLNINGYFWKDSHTTVNVNKYCFGLHIKI